MIYLVFPIVIILALLLSLGRSLLGDVVHLISAIAGFVLAIMLTPAAAELLTGWLKNALQGQVTINDTMARIAGSIISPLTFTLVFIVAFTLIGLVTHIIHSFIKPKNKPKFLPKLLINVLCGWLIAYAIMLPFSYYPNKLQPILEMAQTLGLDVDGSAVTLDDYRLPELVYRPLLNRMNRISFESVTVSVDDIIEAYHQLSSVDLEDAQQRSELIESLKADPKKDELYGAVVQILADNITQSTVRKACQQEGKLSSKLSAMDALNKVTSLFKLFNGDSEEHLRSLIATLDGETANIVAALCDFDTLKMIHLYIGNNAPLIAEIIRGIGELDDRSNETIAREAKVLNYLFSPHGTKVYGLNYNEMDAKVMAGYINESVLLQNAYIRVTEGGKVMDPCKTTSYVFNSNASMIIDTLIRQYGFSMESELCKSLMAYFGLTEV